MNTDDVVAMAERARELEQKPAELTQGEEALRESEARYRLLVEESPDIIGIFQDGRLVFINSTGARKVGAKNKSELLGRKSEDFIHPEDLPAAMARLQRRLAGETGVYPAEVRYLRLDGTALPMEVSAAPTLFRDRIAVQFIARDITERKRAEEALRESERQFRTLFENAPIGIGVVDEAGNVLGCNDAALESIGYSREDVSEGVNAVMLYFDPKQREDVLTRFRQQGGLKSYPVLWKRKDGSPFDALLSLTPSTFGGKPCIQSIIEDITERKRAEEALRESENALRESQVIAGLGSYVLNIATGRWKSSAVLDKLFGIDNGYERSIEAWVALIHPDDRAMMLDHFQKEVVGEGRAFDKEYRIVRRNDEAERWVHGLGKLGFDAQGHLLNMHGTIQDITERKQADAEKTKLDAESQQAQRMESVGRLAGGVAHEFNNMLQAILGNVDLALEKTPAVGPVRESLEEIQKAARRSADLTQQLLAFGRKQTIVPKVVDLNATVEGLLKMVRRLTGEGVHLVWVPEAGLGPVKVDPGQIDQILANLCLNACDAIGGVGKIRIETGSASFDEGYCTDHPEVRPGAYVRLVVSDEGRGMDEHTMAHLFEPFFTTKDVGRGTGLGLATVYGIVEQNRGFIEVDSEPGKGATFRIYLPRHEG